MINYIKLDAKVEASWEIGNISDSLPDEGNIKEGGSHPDEGGDFGVNGEHSHARIILACQRVHYVLANHRFVLLPLLLMVCLRVEEAVIAQPAQALEEVDVCHALAKKCHLAVVLEDLQLHEVGDDVADVTEEDERLEGCQCRLSPC